MKKNLLILVMSLSLWVMPKTNFCQILDLGSLVNFAILSGAGAVTNTGNSTYTGNIGTDIGSISGFGSPTTVNGTIYHAVPQTVQAKIDLLNFYIHLSNVPVTNTSHAVTFSGETITAGVYVIAGAGSLAGAITLDGGGNPDAFFIIKFEGALTAAMGTTVILTNGTRSANVFWIAEGAISIGNGTTIKGTLIAHPGAITFGTGGILDGRMLATEGAITFGPGNAAVPTTLSTISISCNSTCDNAILGTAANYAMFSSEGAVSNASSSSGFIGDIGSNAGAVVNFAASVVVGTVHNNPDASTAQAKIDLQAAYTQLIALPVTNSSHTPAFGSGETLTPGVYSIASAGSIAGTLTLNGMGNMAARFVFKFAGAFNTAGQSKVILINGARRCNIFWIAEGAIGMGTFTFMKGNLIAHGGANNMEANGNLEGRMYSTKGGVGFSTGVAYITYSLCGFGILPVNWIYFRGKPVQKKVLLEWATSNETNNGFFTIEKSRDALHFETLTSVNVNTGNSNTENRYSFTDGQPYNLGYYRISQTDKDGKRNYFNTIPVKMNADQSIHVLQYLQGNYIYVEASGAIPADGSIVLYNLAGQRMSSQKIMLTNEVSKYRIDKPLQKGMYLLHVESSKGERYNGKLMVL